MLPLVTEKGIALTHLIVCSFHINLNSEIHLNDYPPGDTHFNTVWAEAKVLKDADVKIMGMVGGAAAGSFSTSTLDGNDTAFEHYYGQLRDVIIDFGLQGMDLDVEQSMSQAGITRLVDRLFEDFGQDFIITLAPVASALRNGGNLSGFDYEDLEAAVGVAIDFYNAQFYNGFGSMTNTAAFDSVISNGWSPQKIVVGQITTPANGGQYVPFDTLNTTITQLRAKYGEIGGIMGWEYFNSEPGGTSEPWEWAQEMTKILRPNDSVNLTITVDKAKALEAAWRSSVISTESQGLNVENVQEKPGVDYMAMINA
ncbi:putative chitinase 3 protein [Phaeoacremonium minimum UCRPA7]|uniref:Putative chitinase 3 protein n=1 Tax=Phaeoacremonium minimum (strain UCR-PA7) TaxID=1286976 RepID=R8BEA1_PHAM7|nr:putative chitinase 3 protein [Phaeoacremonium minimum UCRPA7]EON97633.1 putative chitinase 3 protein [Phaeoacremonium minimum UCRPA7]